MRGRAQGAVVVRRLPAHASFHLDALDFDLAVAFVAQAVAPSVEASPLSPTGDRVPIPEDRIVNPAARQRVAPKLGLIRHPSAQESAL
jgi:hypothetical protein